MEKFTKLVGVAAPMPMANVDTDQIIPKQFLQTIERKGLAAGLFYELRFDEAGAEKPDFVLNKPQYRAAQVLIAGENFGCGSSREHAPWALLDYGVRCVIAPSFADIFYNNCFKNGVLPITLPQEIIDTLMDEAKGGNHMFTVDLEAQQIIGPSGEAIAFDIDPARKHNLLNGLDDIGLSLAKAKSIDDFEDKQKTSQPWL